jgi:hypothetical protein
VALADLPVDVVADFFAVLTLKEAGTTREAKPFFNLRFEAKGRSLAFAVWNDMGWFGLANHLLALALPYAALSLPLAILLLRAAIVAPALYLTGTKNKWRLALQTAAVVGAIEVVVLANIARQMRLQAPKVQP